MERTDKYRKDQKQENLLERINEVLESVERDLISEFDEPKLPTVFIIGAPRSATTLIHQLVAETGVFGYISNFMARFWLAPYFGAMQEKVLGFRETSDMSYQSDFGRTKGWHEPHQFNYFWQKWYQFDEHHQMDQEYIDSMDTTLFKKEIAALEHHFEKPVAFKSLYCGLQVKFLKRTLKQSKFVICTRDPLYQAQSILSGRKAFFGDFDGWFSLKPPEYHALEEKSVFEQVTGQVYYILKSIGSGLKMMNVDDYLIIDQEDLTRDPIGSIKGVVELANANPSDVDWSIVPETFENRNVRKLDEESWSKLEQAMDEFFGERSCEDILLDR